MISEKSRKKVRKICIFLPLIVVFSIILILISIFFKHDYANFNFFGMDTFIVVSSDKNIEKEIKQNNPETIFLLFGEETYLLEISLKRIKKNFGETISGINFVTLYENNVENLIQEIETPAFGYEKKLIIIRDSKIFQKGGKGKSKEKEQTIQKINNKIKENYNDIVKDCVIIFVEESVEKNKLYNTLEKLGTVCNFEALKINQLNAKLSSICRAYKVEIASNDINYLIENSGTNMQDLINEIRKLIEYAGEGGTIKREDIDALCTKQIQAVIFDLTDNLGQKKVKEAMEVLYNLIASKEPIQKILITLYNHFKKLYFVKLSIEYNKDIAESLQLKPNQMFLVNKYRQQAKSFKTSELKNIIQKLQDLDYKYKIGLIDLNVGLEAILCAYCS